MSRVEFPQGVKNAIGELILYALSRSLDVDNGAYLEMKNTSLGDPVDGLKLGNWGITLTRTTAPDAMMEARK